MRVFILDDLRSIAQAIDNTSDPRLFRPRYDPLIYAIAREPLQAEDQIRREQRYDAWILDNDLGVIHGVAEEGYNFLRQMIVNSPSLVPDIMVSCSSNPARRADIEALHRNWVDAGRPVVDYI